MSREYNLGLSLSQVKAGDRQDLLNILRGFGNCDCDFNGKNGDEYNWEETNENGFDSNVDYLIDFVKDIEDDEECVNKFFDYWMSKDGNYYADYSVELIKDSKNRITAIAFATMSGY